MYYWKDHLTKTTEENDIKQIEGMFKKKHFVGWSCTDGVCGNILKYWCAGNRANTEAIAAWSTEKGDIWKQRASCVSFVNLARFGDNEKKNFKGFLDCMFGVCDNVVESQERFV